MMGIFGRRSDREQGTDPETASQSNERSHLADLPCLKWNKFAGCANSMTTIREKAIDLSKGIVIVATETMDDIQKGIGGPISNRRPENLQLWNCYYEIQIYLIHLAQRESHELLGEELREEFLRCLIEGVTDRCASEFPDQEKVGGFRTNFIENLRLFVQEFSLYSRAECDDITQSLLYKLSSRLAERFGATGDLKTIMTISVQLVPAELYLNLPGLLTEIAAEG